MWQEFNDSIECGPRAFKAVEIVESIPRIDKDKEYVATCWIFKTRLKFEAWNFTGVPRVMDVCDMSVLQE